MGNYFYDMIPVEELAQLRYIPTVSEFVGWIEQKWGDLPAVNDLENKYNYRQFCKRIARRRAYLNSLGLQKGDIVAIFDKNSIAAVELFLAITSNGQTALILPASLPAPAVVGCCAKFRIKALFVRDEMKPLSEGAPCPVYSTGSIADSEAPAVEVDKEDPAAIFFTGGTTGAPKGAILPHRALMRGAYNGCFAPGKQLGCHRYVCLLPLNHVFGLIRSTLSAFYTGAEWYAAEDMKTAVGSLHAIKPTILVLVPGLCEILLSLAQVHGPRFLGGQLKTIISGAANVPPKLMKEFDTIGISLLAGYGMTEAANLTSGNKDVRERPTSVGKIYPEQEAKIVDGELWIKGDNLFLGYYGEPEKTAEAFSADGWLKTGDLARFDEDGYLYIVGRIKNIIILDNGENISPEEIEEPFYKYAQVRDCLVSEVEKEGRKVIGIEILPRPEAVEGKSPEEIEAFFSAMVDEVNAIMPSTHRIASVTIRKEDFKRTGSLKVARNQK